MNQVPLISIICITYNHRNYISQAIESFLIQKTTFPFEVIIHDDASTDGTREIVQNYENNYPDIIKGIYPTENQYTLGKKITPMVLPLCRGKYVALCEGDDYWLDPYKLQKQTDFLEANSEFVICSHNALILNDNRFSLFKSNLLKQQILTDIDIARENIFTTCSIVFRNNLISIPKWFNNSLFGDWPLYLLLLEHGRACLFDQVMSVYRVHSGGVWSSSSRIKQLERTIEGVKFLNVCFEGKYEIQMLTYLNKLESDLKKICINNNKTKSSLGDRLKRKLVRIFS